MIGGLMNLPIPVPTFTILVVTTADKEFQRTTPKASQALLRLLPAGYLAAPETERLVIRKKPRLSQSPPKRAKT